MQNRFPIALCGITYISLCLLGCAFDSPEVSVEVTCDEFREQPAISQEVEVTAGNTFTVTLCSSPATSFLWSELAEISEETLLEQVDHKAQIDSITGGDGQEVWTFRALEEGECTIALEYNRPWVADSSQSLWEFTLDVVVK